jgi:hypothetical protein
MVVLAGCAVESYEIEAAEKACAPHGGIKYLYALPKNEATCNDGIRISSFIDL